MPSANEGIADRLVHHAIGLQRLSQASLRRVLAALREADRRIVERLASGYEPESSAKRQRALLQEIRGILDSVYRDQEGRLRLEFEALSEYEVEVLADAISVEVPNLGFRLPSADALHAAVYSRPFQGRLMKEWFSDLPEQAFSRLRRVIRQGYVEGRTTDEVIREIRGTKAQGYRDGVNGVNRRAAEVTVRTAIAHVSNAARQRGYESNKRFLRGVQWASVLDSRTSLICAGRDGKVYPIDSGPRPPAHPRCRSTTVPVLKSASELPQERLTETEIAALDGEPSGDLTFGPWLRRQGVEVQNDILGQKKAILFRRGELPIDRFTDKSGREYSLDDLRRRNREAWEKAGLS